MAVQTNIVTDVNNLLRIPTKISNEIVAKSCLCIGSAISEAKARGESQLTVCISRSLMRRMPSP